MNAVSNKLEDVRLAFEAKSGLSDLPYEIIKGRSNDVLKLFVSSPSERLYEILEEARKSVADLDEDPPVATLAKRSSENLLEGPEGRLFLRVLSESLNVNLFTFENDFMHRYTKSVSGAESQIITAANHVVFGRRGAGKSMLLLYSRHVRKQEDKPSVWVDMQVYSGRSDDEVIADVLVEILDQSVKLLKSDNAQIEMIGKLKVPGITREKIRRLLPEIRRFLGQFYQSGSDLFIFLDDYHVLGRALQPYLLDVIYAFSRGNRVFLKLSAIETLTRTYNTELNQGLEIPQDAQSIHLDFNLTAPDNATSHIEAILNSHVEYSGLRSVRSLCTSANVIPRLTWVAAGVPRDALNFFFVAITKATKGGRKKVSVSNVNVAASEALSAKLRDIETDASESAAELKLLIERIRVFCVTEKRKNAFLIEIRQDNELYKNVMDLVHLRLLHVISEGVTIGEAGRKYLGLILDYGFYTGIRAAQSVDLFNRQSRRVAYRDLRGLPVFKQ